MVHLFFTAKKRYYATLGKLPLKERYLLSESYQLCQTCFVATFCALAINIALFISFWLFVFNIIPYNVLYQYFMVYDMTLNISATLFPILFLRDAKKYRCKVTSIKSGHNQSGNLEVRQLDGNKISTSQTQEEYFQQLQSSWA
ncbi:hypothetical protein GCK72_016693 [Caenorhabditis remanei]|uniref:7TM GPCR serpentine receptor class x (Srx) domain-containing protein n=1 Tax=Caenorhabditis remanei TaxID=31234 RepID=A0A6A5G5K1_CAERE|nr:hypothetical protein GCK72_016693 [Caenorhabditis remanei]KAF1750146.1 hypothetical protein GCK72_016693 [Caenorhabditis remanei]